MKAIIFDFDGTLANTLPICYAAFNKVFRTFDQRILSNAEIISMFGPSETGIIQKNLKHDDKEGAIDSYYEHYELHHKELVCHNDEINEMIKQLKIRGFQLAIVTGKARKSLNISLKALHLTNYFDVIVTGDDVKDPKPHPEGINKALLQLKCKPSEAIFIGDSEADIQAGKAALVTTIAAKWFEETQTTQFETKADIELDDYQALSQWLDTMIRNG